MAPFLCRRLSPTNNQNKQTSVKKQTNKTKKNTCTKLHIIFVVLMLYFIVATSCPSSASFFCRFVYIQCKICKHTWTCRRTKTWWTRCDFDDNNRPLFCCCCCCCFRLKNNNFITSKKYDRKQNECGINENHHWNGWVQSSISQVEKFIHYQCLILLRGSWYWVQIHRSHDAILASCLMLNFKQQQAIII